jgi:hypothetical protein
VDGVTVAHFAELNAENVVTNVIVISNADTLDADGNESEAVGITFCRSLFGEDTRWVQTSYNGNSRGKYAGIGDFYNADLDVFVPAPSETFNPPMELVVPIEE